MFKLFCGNLNYQTTEVELKEAFSAFGEVKSAKVITDRETGRSRGFGFIEFDNAEDGKAAIAELNGALVDGRNIVVNEAENKPRTGGGGGPRGGSSGGGGGYDRQVDRSEKGGRRDRNRS